MANVKKRVDLVREDASAGKSFTNSFLMDANVTPTVDLFKSAVHDYIQNCLVRGDTSKIWEDFNWGDAMHQLPKEIWNRHGIDPVEGNTKTHGAASITLKVQQDEILLPPDSYKKVPLASQIQSAAKRAAEQGRGTQTNVKNNDFVK